MRKHISEDGEVRPCHAKTEESCTAKGPGGERAEHFYNDEEAKSRSEQIKEEMYGKFNTISSKKLTKDGFSAVPVDDETQEDITEKHMGEMTFSFVGDTEEERYDSFVKVKEAFTSWKEFADYGDYDYNEDVKNLDDKIFTELYSNREAVKAFKLDGYDPFDDDNEESEEDFYKADDYRRNPSLFKHS